MKLKIVSVIGSKKSGRTAIIENLIFELTKRGYKVAAIRHIPERYFTLDTPGKDSYRYSEHGAKTVIAVSANEIATIEKIPTETIPFKKIFGKCKGNDIIILEEATKIFAQKLEIPKIAVAKTQEEAQFISDTCTPIIAFSGPYDTQELFPSIPYVDALKNPGVLADIVETKVLKN